VLKLWEMLPLSSSTFFPEWLKKYQECVESQLEAHFAKAQSPLEVRSLDAIAGGKRLRAVLTLLWCEALSGDYTRASEIAAAYELAHCAALIQDDVIDHSSMRRGQSSTLGKYGTAGAILAANTLLFFVPKLISEFAHKSDDVALISKLLDLFGECYRSSSLGEYFDLEMANSQSISEKDYEEMIRLKTGSMVGAASASGALIGKGANDNPVIVSAAYDYGESLGVAYQVQDDMLDIFGDEQIIGKPVFNDIANGKKSLMIIRFLNVCRVDSEILFVKNMLESKGGSITADGIGRMRELLLKYDCESYAKNFAELHIQRAEDSLKILKSSTASERLFELTSILSARNY
jgi:geranylgeranyl pyrophosphate synthase